MMTPCRVLITDDHPHSRQAIKEILADEPLFKVIGEAANGKEAVELCDMLLPDMVLMDIQMPVLNGLEATKLIKEKNPLIKVIILSVSDDVADLFIAIQYGAQGYLLKNMDPDDWLQYLRSVADGSTYAARGMAGKLLYQFREADYEHAPTPQNLTAREKEILLLVAKGLTNKQIGQQLFIAENTVKNHIKSLLGKLEVENRVQLALYAMKSGLV